LATILNRHQKYLLFRIKQKITLQKVTSAYTVAQSQYFFNKYLGLPHWFIDSVFTFAPALGVCMVGVVFGWFFFVWLIWWFVLIWVLCLVGFFVVCFCWDVVGYVLGKIVLFLFCLLLGVFCTFAVPKNGACRIEFSARFGWALT
jgi:hypothetical protein